MTEPNDLSRPGTADPSISELIGTWRGPLAWLIEEDSIPPRRQEEIICVVRQGRLEDGQPMAFIFAVDDERLASAETLIVSRTMRDGGWIADGILLHPGFWDLRVVEGRLMGTYMDKDRNRAIKRFEAQRMVAW